MTVKNAPFLAQLRARGENFARFAGLLTVHFVQGLKEWRDARVTLRELNRLNDHMLQDIGLDRGILMNPAAGHNRMGLAAYAVRAWQRAKADLAPALSANAAANDTAEVSRMVPRKAA